MQTDRCAYRDRFEAGKEPAAHLIEYAESRDAMENLKVMKPRRTIIAVPLGSPSTCSQLGSAADAIVCPLLVSGDDKAYVCYEDSSEVTDL